MKSFNYKVLFFNAKYIYTKVVLTGINATGNTTQHDILR